jgi:4-diphosphocytidyl-2-C-methyl-D-erythritol kinase
LTIASSDERSGIQLGADVPFFLGGNNAFVSGIGENLRPISLPPAQLSG